MIEDLGDLYAPAPLRRSLISVWMVLYRKATGEVTQVMRQSPETVSALLSAEIASCEIPGIGLAGMMEGLAYARAHYVDTSTFHPQIRERTACPASLDGLALRSLPLPCQIEITAPLNATRTYDEADDPDLDLSFDHPGTYTVRVLSARHLPGVFTVTV